MDADEPRRPAIAITGANGYLGDRLVSSALRRGYKIHALGRRPLQRAGVTNIPFDLAVEGDIKLPIEVGALVHFAADTAARLERTGRSEVAAAEALMDALPDGGKFLFVSSQSARTDAVSEYGRRKWAIETLVTRRGGACVRPGFVYGGPEKGLYGRICRALRMLPLLPLFVAPRPLAQPIHVDDLAEGLLRILEHAWRPGTVVKLAAPDAMPFDRMLKAIAERHLALRRRFVPVPLGFVARTLSLLSVILRRDLAAGQLAALAQTKAMSTTSDLERLGLRLRSLEAGLGRSRESESKRRLAEGVRLLAYVLGHRPKPSLLIRYARALEAGGHDALIDCRSSIPRSSIALALLDRRGATDDRDQDLTRRLALALRIAEASPQSFHRFLGDAGPRLRRIEATAAVAGAIAREFMVRALRPLLERRARMHLMRSELDP